MVKVREDLTGRQFGKLTVIKQVEDYVTTGGFRYSQWLCECDCEDKNQVLVRGAYLTSGHTQSCGCLVSEVVSARMIGNDYGKWANKKENKKDLSGSYGIIWSTNTDEKIYFDLDRADDVLKYSWGISNTTGYPVTTINKKTVSMHIYLGYKHHDHHNRNKLDNRSENLIKCTQQENVRNRSMQSNNTSGIIGVSWDKNRNKWLAHITISKKMKNIGRFVNKEDAIRARLQAEAKYFKDFAPQRHLFEQYGIEYNSENKIKGGESNE